MTIAIILFGLVFLLGLALGTITRHPFPTACVVVAAFVGLLVSQTDNMFAAFAVFSLISITGFVVDSVRETVGILLGR